VNTGPTEAGFFMFSQLVNGIPFWAVDFPDDGRFSCLLKPGYAEEFRIDGSFITHFPSVCFYPFGTDGTPI
jgi:hypothetical protein